MKESVEITLMCDDQIEINEGTPTYIIAKRCCVSSQFSI